MNSLGYLVRHIRMVLACHTLTNGTLQYFSKLQNYHAAILYANLVMGREDNDQLGANINQYTKP